MLFDGRTFFEVGDLLQGKVAIKPNDEAQIRSCIGRYYYACFHVARRIFKAEENWNSREKSSHSKISRAVNKNCGPTVSSMLDTLRIMREHADYHCWPPKTKLMGIKEFESCPCDWGPDLLENSQEACVIAIAVLQGLDKYEMERKKPEPERT